MTHGALSRFPVVLVRGSALFLRRTSTPTPRARRTFDIVSVHARDYDIDAPADLDTLYGSAVLVLRRES